MADSHDGYRAATSGVGWIDRSDRVRLDINGPDRAKFLHNLTTNEVKRLIVGQGRETFITNSQGRTLGFTSLLAVEDRIILRSDPGSLPPMLAHFQKYGLFDDVGWDDASERTFEFHVVGPRVSHLLERLGVQLPPEEDLSHLAAEIQGRGVRLVRESPTGRTGLTLLGDRSDASVVAEAIRAAGEGLDLVAIAPRAFEVMRIEAGTPVFGQDVSAENLPQEVGRDSRTISFVKGCYLGQETVARLDALGHVNKVLKGIHLRSEQPVAAGTTLEADGKRVGTITSSAPAPEGSGQIALAYVRMTHSRSGTELVAPIGEERSIAIVADLPMLPSFGQD